MAFKLELVLIAAQRLSFGKFFRVPRQSSLPYIQYGCVAFPRPRKNLLRNPSISGYENKFLAVTASYREEFNMAENYISNVLFSPIAAHNLAVRLDQAVSLIESNPFIFPLYHDEKIAKRGYRFASVSNYLLFYRVDENNIVIYLLHFLNGRQNIQMYIK